MDTLLQIYTAERFRATQFAQKVKESRQLHRQTNILAQSQAQTRAPTPDQAPAKSFQIRQGKAVAVAESGVRSGVAV